MPRCPESGQSAGGVLLVIHHVAHGPCLVVFHNRDPKRHWECPYGSYEAKHQNVVVTAAAELFEETCGLVDIEPGVLSNFAQRGPAVYGHQASRNCFHNGVFAIRVDNLRRQVFDSNRAAIQRLDKKWKLRPWLEMDEMRFVPLDRLETILSKKGVCAVADVDGRIIEIGLLAKQLRAGGLNLVRRAYDSGDVATRYPSTLFSNPAISLNNGRCTLYGVRSLTVRAYDQATWQCPPAYAPGAPGQYDTVPSIRCGATKTTTKKEKQKQKQKQKSRSPSPATRRRRWSPVRKDILALVVVFLAWTYYGMFNIFSFMGNLDTRASEEVLPALLLCSAFVWLSIKSIKPGRSELRKFLQKQKTKTKKSQVKFPRLSFAAPQTRMDILALVLVVLGCMFYGTFSVFFWMRN